MEERKNLTECSYFRCRFVPKRLHWPKSLPHSGKIRQLVLHIRSKQPTLLIGSSELKWGF
jgi:hypothetical protein